MVAESVPGQDPFDGAEDAEVLARGHHQHARFNGDVPLVRLGLRLRRVGVNANFGPICAWWSRLRRAYFF
jgi:hypothetical protein